MSPFFDRRQSLRYSINLDAQFTVRKQGKVQDTGNGKIQNVCRSGMFFESSEIIPCGSVLQMVVDWPVLFEGTTSIQWVIDCVVVRSSSSGTAVQIMRQKFERSAQETRTFAG